MILLKKIKIVTDGMIKKNDLSKFKEYVDENEEFKKNAIEISYGYNLDLQIYSSRSIKVNPNTFSVFSGIPIESDDAKSIMSSYTKAESVFTEILDNEEFLKDQYEVLAGTFPKNYNEVVILVSKDNEPNIFLATTPAHTKPRVNLALKCPPPL